MPIDTKDWFTDQFATQNDTLVADRDWIHKLYGIATGAEMSIRLLSSMRSDRHQPVLIIKHDNPYILDELCLHEHLADLRDSVLSFNTRLPIIVVPATPCLLADARYGVYCGRHGTRVKTAEGLANFLAWFNPDLVLQAGASKAIYHDVRDAYQLFTRGFLSSSLVVQDMDMLRKVEGRWQAVELKRFGETPSTWMPYLDDARNFEALEQASAALGMHKPICIGYRKWREGANPLVTVHDVNATRAGLTGRRHMSDVEHVFDVQPGEHYVSTRSVRK